MKQNKINPEIHEIFKGQRPELLAFIELMYDMDSPLAIEYPDLKTRRIQAAARAGLDLTDESVLEQVNLKTEEMQELVHYYLTCIVASNQWSLLITNQMVMNEYLEICMRPLDLNDDKIGQSKVKTTLLKDCGMLSKDIDALTKEIFRDMEDESAYGQRQKRITVESMAQDMARQRKEQRELVAEKADMSKTETVGDDED